MKNEKGTPKQIKQGAWVVLSIKRTYNKEPYKIRVYKNGKLLLL